MSFNELIGVIESAEFSAKMNLASGRNLFFRLVDEDKFILDFIELVKNNPDKVVEVLSRIELLSRIRINPRYENPNDIAISTYCWALYKISPQIGKIAATLAVSASGIWWANEVAVFILEDSFRVQKNTNSVVDESSYEKTTLRFSPKNKKPSISENSPIPILLFEDIAKYKISNDFEAVSTSSYIPEPKSYEWKDFLGKFFPKFNGFSENNNDTVLAANWR